MFNDSHILCISPIDWDFLWQRHQIFMTMFAKEGNQVFYLENLNPSPAFDLSIFQKILKRAARITLKPNHQNKPKLPNITVITPLIIPGKNKFAEFINKNILLRLLVFYLKSKKIKNPVIWTYLATSSAVKLINYLKPKFLIYDCVFDASLHPNSPKDIKVSEREIIKAADLIFTDSQHLFKKFRDLNTNTYIIPPGVDFEHFGNPPLIKDEAMFVRIPKPRICFFGGIDKMRLDMELIKYIAEEYSSWSIVLFGPIINTEISDLKLKNVYFEGVIPHTKLAGYLSEMDVFILPYKIIPFSKSIFPAKIFECMATGKPIVSTPLEELNCLEEGVIRIGKTKEEFAQAIQDSLISDTQTQKQKRLGIAKENSWEERFEKIKVILEKYLREKI